MEFDQGTFERLASDNFPFVFNNTCLSWREIAASFIDAGCRGYIGTLWSVGNDSAREAARVFYDRCWSQPIIAAFYDMSKAIVATADRDIYLFWGLHFSSICSLEETSNERVVSELKTAAARWTSKARREDLPPRIRERCAESLQKVLRLLLVNPAFETRSSAGIARVWPQTLLLSAMMNLPSGALSRLPAKGRKPNAGVTDFLTRARGSDLEAQIHILNRHKFAKPKLGFALPVSSQREV